MVHLQKIWIMVLDSIYWERTGGHESTKTKLNYQLFRKCSLSVVVIVGNRVGMVANFLLAFFPIILASSGNQIKLSSLILKKKKRIFNLHVESKWFNVLAVKKKCVPTFLLPPVWFVFQVEANHWLLNWLIHWGEFVWCVFEFKPVTYLADVCVCMFVCAWVDAFMSIEICVLSTPCV